MELILPSLLYKHLKSKYVFRMEAGSMSPTPVTHNPFSKTEFLTDQICWQTEVNVFDGKSCQFSDVFSMEFDESSITFIQTLNLTIVNTRKSINTPSGFFSSLYMESPRQVSFLSLGWRLAHTCCGCANCFAF